MKRTKRALFSGVLFLIVLSMLLFGMIGGANAASSRAANAAPATCGKWTIVPSGSTIVSLQAVTALAANDVWAVGSGRGTHYVPTYTEHWNGTQWTTVASPSVKKQVNLLFAVSADASNDVWTVGYYGPLSGTPAQALIEHWDGTKWSIVPNPNESGSALYGVAAITPDNVWAVGSYGTNGNLSSLIEHWDGTQWSIVNSPVPPGAIRYSLAGITVISASNIWAAGSYQAGSYYKQHDLIEHWDGTQWSIVKTPTHKYGVNLTAITAVSASDIWAVGITHGKGVNGYAFAEHWNGSQWSIVPIPSLLKTEDYLYSITAVSSSDIWAVGQVLHNGLVEHWDGTQWHIVKRPEVPNSYGTLLEGASALSDGTVWAVGVYYGPPGVYGPVNAYTC